MPARSAPGLTIGIHPHGAEALTQPLAGLLALLALYLPQLPLLWIGPLVGHTHCRAIDLELFPVPGALLIGGGRPVGVGGWLLGMLIPTLVVLTLTWALVRRPRLGGVLVALVALLSGLHAIWLATVLRA